MLGLKKKGIFSWRTVILILQLEKPCVITLNLTKNAY